MTTWSNLLLIISFYYCMLKNLCWCDGRDDVCLLRYSIQNKEYLDMKLKMINVPSTVTSYQTSTMIREVEHSLDRNEITDNLSIFIQLNSTYNNAYIFVRLLHNTELCNKKPVIQILMDNDIHTNQDCPPVDWFNECSANNKPPPARTTLQPTYTNPPRAITTTPKPTYTNPPRAITTTPKPKYTKPPRAITTTPKPTYTKPPRAITTTPKPTYTKPPPAKTTSPKPTYTKPPPAKTTVPKLTSKSPATVAGGSRQGSQPVKADSTSPNESPNTLVIVGVVCGLIVILQLLYAVWKWTSKRRIPSNQLETYSLPQVQYVDLQLVNTNRRLIANQIPYGQVIGVLEQAK